MSHFTSQLAAADETNSIIAVSTPAHVPRNFIRPVCTLRDLHADKQLEVGELLAYADLCEAATPIRSCTTASRVLCGTGDGVHGS